MSHCASNNVSSGVANTSTVDPSLVAEDFNQVRKNIYDIGNYCQSNSVRSLTNEGKISLVENVWKSQPEYKFPSTFSSSSSNHTRSFQMKWLEEFEWVNANDNFKTLYAQVNEIASKLDIKEEIPRVCRLQTARNNVPYSTEEEYYRRAVYVPYLDDFCNSLKERFESHKETVASLQHIFPEFYTKTGFYLSEAAFNFYEEDVSHKEVVQSEFILWKEKWSQEKSENLPKTAISSLEKCDKTFFPNIYILLKLLAVLPVSVATVERSFASLRRLKIYLRNITSERTLNGLSLLSIHSDIKIRVEEVLDKFASVPRNLDFVL
ncbi:repressor of the inhibitor of the protein kinase [Araneus ventricosus]|uniref:Repressor of the inhibitor of the protein kinase n=1 Tax=Araneus ventricosus TaxID=182803 RepID=A0A4Y2FBU1_ARAVE|nr:repressor of the inhibitor of the protein kinase [Araneus ventricosus]